MLLLLLLLQRHHLSIHPSLHPSLEEKAENKEWLCDSPQAGGEAHKGERNSRERRRGAFPCTVLPILTPRHGYNVMHMELLLQERWTQRCCPERIASVQTSSFLLHAEELKGLNRSKKGVTEKGGGGPLCSGLDHGYSWVDNTDVDVIA